MVFRWRLLFLLVLALQAAAKLTDDTAVVVSTGNAHYEIVAFFLHHFQALGLKTITFTVPNPAITANMNNFIKPMTSDVRYLYYNTSNLPMAYKVLVYISMSKYFDMVSTCRHGLHNALYHRAERVIMVNHHAGAVYELHAVCRAPKCTVFNIAPHVQNTVVQLLSAKNISDCQARNAYALYDHKLPNRMPVALVKEQQSFTKSTRLIAIQGNIELSRRRYDLLFECMRDIRQHGMDLRLLNVGHKSEGFVIPADVAPAVMVLSDLPFDEFYTALRQAEVLVAFTNTAMHYESTRSSSSIPTAMVNHMPIVLPKGLLKVYECLQASPIHQRIAHEDDCSSLKAALALSAEDRTKMREEVQHCRTLWLAEGTRVIREILEEPTAAAVSGEGKHSNCSTIGIDRVQQQ